MKRALKGLIVAVLVVFSATAALEFRWEAGEKEKAAAGFLAAPILGEKAGELAKIYCIAPVREEAELPSFYDYREEGRSVPVRDQGQFGTCWAFASLTALETSLTPEQICDFSRDHLNFHNDYQMETEEGGSYIMSVSYLTSWQGPVLEEDDPYGDNESPDGLEPVCHVQDVRMPGDRDFEAIRQIVFPTRSRTQPITAEEIPATAMTGTQGRTMTW